MHRREQAQASCCAGHREADRPGTGGRSCFFHALGERLKLAIAIAVEFNTPGYELDRGRDGKDVVSKREMYERFSTPHLIQDPDVPDEGEHLWEWFWHLSGRRMQGMDGPLALTYPEIEAWSRLTGEVVLREELLIITAMDDTYLSALANERGAQRAANEKK